MPTAASMNPTSHAALLSRCAAFISHGAALLTYDRAGAGHSRQRLQSLSRPRPARAGEERRPPGGSSPRGSRAPAPWRRIPSWIPSSWRRDSFSRRHWSAACILSPVMAPPAGDGARSRAGSQMDWIAFLYLFRDSIAILFSIPGLLCKKVGHVRNFEC
jgi:hypothetical protein